MLHRWDPLSVADIKDEHMLKSTILKGYIMALTQTKALIKATRNSLLYGAEFTSVLTAGTFTGIKKSLPNLHAVLTGTKDETEHIARSDAHTVLDYAGSFKAGSILGDLDTADAERVSDKEFYAEEIALLKEKIAATTDVDDLESLNLKLARKEARYNTL